VPLNEISKAGWPGWKFAQRRLTGPIGTQHITEKPRRAVVEICDAIRERLLLMGLDPALALSLQRGGKAAAELAAIPDSEALRAADEAITRGDQNDDGEALGIPMPQIERMAKHFDDGSQPDLANASLAQLFAFCFGNKKLP
jgi:hypothetical protein